MAGVFISSDPSILVPTIVANATSQSAYNDAKEMIPEMNQHVVDNFNMAESILNYRPTL
jgi:hypothetical protein